MHNHLSKISQVRRKREKGIIGTTGSLYNHVKKFTLSSFRTFNSLMLSCSCSIAVTETLKQRVAIVYYLNEVAGSCLKTIPDEKDVCA